MNPATIAANTARAIARRSANIAKRVARIEAAGGNTEAIEEFRKLQRSPKPQDKAQAQERLAALRRLDKSRGTRAATAGREGARFQTASELSRNPRALPDAAAVDDLYSSLRRSVSAQVQQVKRDPMLGSNNATHLYDEFMKDAPKNPTRRQKAALTRRLIDISKYQGINKAGAQKQLQRGVEAFGDDYAKWSPEQRSAAWEGFRELAERRNSTVSSDKLLAEITAASKEGSLKTAFYQRTEDDGRGGTRQVLAASVSTHMDDASQEAFRLEYQSKKLAELRAKSTGRARLI